MAVYKSLSLPFACLIAIQILDTLVHAAADQIEPIRITSNLVIIVGAVGAYLSGRLNMVLSVLAGMTYIALNAAFLNKAGFTNPDTDTLRVPLFIFVVASLLILIWLTRRTSSNRAADR